MLKEGLRPCPFWGLCFARTNKPSLGSTWREHRGKPGAHAPSLDSDASWLMVNPAPCFGELVPLAISRPFFGFNSSTAAADARDLHYNLGPKNREHVFFLAVNTAY